MANSSGQIVHGAGIPMVLIRANLVWVCQQVAIRLGEFPETKKDGAANRSLVLCAAALLNNFIYWSDNKTRYNIKANQENILAELGEKPKPYAINGWTYHTIDDLKAELFEIWGENKVSAAKSLLVRAKFISEKSSKYTTWDKTLAYKLNVRTVQDACNDYIREFKDDAGYVPERPVEPETSEEKKAFTLAKGYITVWQNMFSVVNGKNVYQDHMKIAKGLATKFKLPVPKFAEYLQALKAQEKRTKAPTWEYIGQNWGTWLDKSKPTPPTSDNGKTQPPTNRGIGKASNIDKAVKGVE